MANKDHVRIIKQGVDAWNAWRASEAAIPDLAGVALKQADLRHANLIEANLSGANLHRAQLNRAKLRGANLQGADLTFTRLAHADLSGAMLVGVDLSTTYMQSADFSGAQLSQADLRELILSGTNFYRANLSGAKLDRAKLHGARFVEADLRGAELTDVNFTEADLTGANLEGTYLRGATLKGAVLRRANLSGADLRNANLAFTQLSEAQIGHANLRGANLLRAHLENANLRGSELTGANFTEAILRAADFTETNLGGVDLRAANCERTDFSKANLAEARLINTVLDEAILSGACLWETQRAGWTIKGVICTNVYWDKEAKDVAYFRPGEFERLCSEKSKIRIKYPGGITTQELVTLPALIHHLAAARPGCKLRFESIQDSSEGAVVTITIDEVEATSSDEVEEFRSTIQSEANQKAAHLRSALEYERQAKLLLKGEVQALERMVNNLFSSQKPIYYLESGDISMSEYKTNIEGNFQGAIGANAQAEDLTYNEIGNRIAISMDLSQLADELLKLRQAMSSQAQETSHHVAVAEIAKAEAGARQKDSSKIVESLRSAGKWALDVATKIGVPLATEAIKQSIGLK